MSLFDGLTGCQAGGGFVTDMLMVKTPKQELDERTCGWIYNRLKAPLECFINKWVEGC